MIVLDRYEGTMAVLEENGEMKNIPCALLETGIPEGSVLKRAGEKYVLDQETTEARRAMLAELQDSLFE